MNRWDFLTLIGALLTAAGAAMVYVPAGLIVLGLFGILGGVVGARATVRGDE